MTDCWAQLTWPLPFLRHFLKNSSTSRKSGRPPVVWYLSYSLSLDDENFSPGGLEMESPHLRVKKRQQGWNKEKAQPPPPPLPSPPPWIRSTLDGGGGGGGSGLPPCPHTGLSDFPSETETLTWLSSAESSVKLGGIYYLVQCLLWSHCHVIPGLYGPGCREGWGVNGGHLQENQNGYIIFCFLIDILGLHPSCPPLTLATFWVLTPSWTAKIERTLL